MSNRLTKPFKWRLFFSVLITSAALILGLADAKWHLNISELLIIGTLIALFCLDLLISELFAKSPEELIDEIKPLLAASVGNSNRALDRIESLVEFNSADGSKDLEKFQKSFHHYHLTRDDKSQHIWTYKAINFSRAAIAGRLITYARIRVKQKTNEEEPDYRFEARIRGHDLVISIRRDARRQDTSVPDVSFEIYPRALTKDPPFFGMKLLTTINGEPISSISILRLDAVDPGADEGPVAPEYALQLQNAWERESKIERLPLSRGYSALDPHADSLSEQVLGPHSFWDCHFRNLLCNTVLYSEPLCFRLFIKHQGEKSDKRQDEHWDRLFIRDIDLNDTDLQCSPFELKQKLLPKLPWLNNLLRSNGDYEFEVSRAYIPGGEVFAKDRIREWFQLHSSTLLSRGVLKSVPGFDEMVEHEALWYDLPTHQQLRNRSIAKDNLIILGNARSHPKMQSLQDSSAYQQRFRYRIEANHILIRNVSGEELRRIELARMRFEELQNQVEMDGKDARLFENWRKGSMVLVTRSCENECSGVIITSILANQGRGVQGVIDLLLCGNDQRPWNSLMQGFGLSNAHLFPAEFQMLFYVQLAPIKEEARPFSCTAVLYAPCS